MIEVTSASRLGDGRVASFFCDMEINAEAFLLGFSSGFLKCALAPAFRPSGVLREVRRKNTTGTAFLLCQRLQGR